MKSRCYFAIAVREFESGEKIAVIVFESTSVSNFKPSEIETLINDQTLKISLLVRHLTALDKDLNPFGGSILLQYCSSFGKLENKISFLFFGSM